MQVLAKACTYIAGLKKAKRLVFAFVLGGVTAFALAPFYLVPLAFVTFPVLVVLLDTIAREKRRKRRLELAFLTCYSFALGYFVLSLWWLSSAMLIDPVSFGWAIPFAIFGLPAYLALYWGFAGVLAMLFWYKGASRFLVLAFAIGIGEYLRARLLTGFPWGSIGYTIMPTPLLMQSDAVIGLYAMNTLAVLVYSAPAACFDKRGRIFVLTVAVMLLVAHAGFGMFRLYNAPPIETYENSDKWVRLIQPSIKQDEKLDNEVRYKMFEAHLLLSQLPVTDGAREPNYIVWPETSVPYILDYVPEAKMRIASILKPEQWAIVGAVRSDGAPTEENKHYFNTIEVIDGNGHILDSSDKVHLVPFGEYLPFQNFFDRLGLHALAVITGGYSAAPARKTVTLPDGFVYLPMICYEVIFPDGMDYEGSAPQAILNVTNDAWFKTTPGPYQHFDQARLRAVELGIPLVRAANNGISAVVDPYGRIIASRGLNAVGALDVPIPPTIVPIWNRDSNFTHAFIIFFVILTFSITLDRSKHIRSIDNLKSMRCYDN